MTNKEFFDWLRSMQDDKRLSQGDVDAANALLAAVDTKTLQGYLIELNNWQASTNNTGKMSLSATGANMIKQFEAFRSKPYLDAVKIWTIGYGNTYYPDGRKVSPNDKPLTEAEATKLKTDIINKDFAPKINLLLAHEIAQGKVNQNMFDAIISLAYNIGTNAFAKSSVLRNLKAGNKQAAADSFLAWNKAGGKILKGLVNRRQAERKLFLS